MIDRGSTVHWSGLGWREGEGYVAVIVFVLRQVLFLKCSSFSQCLLVIIFPILYLHYFVDHINSSHIPYLHYPVTLSSIQHLR